MKVDWDELKRLHADRTCDISQRDAESLRKRSDAILKFYELVSENFTAILAEREAAQRLRDAARPFCKIAEGTVGRIPTERLSAANWHELWKATAAFDKESKND